MFYLSFYSTHFLVSSFTSKTVVAVKGSSDSHPSSHVSTQVSLSYTRPRHSRSQTSKPTSTVHLATKHNGNLRITPATMSHPRSTRQRQTHRILPTRSGALVWAGWRRGTRFCGAVVGYGRRDRRTTREGELLVFISLDGLYEPTGR
jgi:hypothetical protein